MGTGILALPADVQSLGRGVGLAFLIFNLPVNLYAGTILSWSALFVEEKILNDSKSGGHEGELELTNERAKKNKRGYSSVHENDYDTPEEIDVPKSINKDSENEDCTEQEWNEDESISEIKSQHQRHTDTATFDFVGMTSILLDEPVIPAMDDSYEKDSVGVIDDTQQIYKRHRSITFNHPLTKGVLLIYYMNLFLVLGTSHNLLHCW
jgi:hypothetical protein